MKLYIRSTGNVSPQHSLDRDAFFSTRVETADNFFKSQEPDYDQFVDSKMIRRMSRIVKMSVAAAMTCLKNAEFDNPAAILTATAYGCLEDSSSFLRRMIEFEEKMLSPTAFIQSTHNTVGAQIALLLKCHHYNNTIVHGSLSFENAITETKLLLEEGIGPVLLGSIDEITDDRHVILSRFGLYKKNKGSGRIAGEGASFFLLDKKPGNHPQAIIRDMKTLCRPDKETEVEHSITRLLQENELTIQDIDLVFTAHSGNIKQDEPDERLLKLFFKKKKTFPFKSLCGNYPTASGFAIWLAALLVKEQKAPVWMKDIQFPLRNILIHQHDENLHHSFILITAC